ncbi:MAG: hypothetical protein LBQ79_05940 [Deltaproteobacteria bacterium]|jgi:hypothetical protein|nr:hypothetical protein [Deltaproteobacteria bacterium]
MRVPSLEAFLLPVLTLVCEGKGTTAGTLVRRTASRLAIPDGEGEPAPPETEQAGTRVRRALRHLMAAGLVRRTVKGKFRATGRGAAAAALGTDRLDFAFLRLMPGYGERLVRARNPVTAKVPASDPALPDGTAGEPPPQGQSGEPMPDPASAPPEPPARQEAYGFSPSLLESAVAALAEKESSALDSLAGCIRRLDRRALLSLARNIVKTLADSSEGTGSDPHDVLGTLQRSLFADGTPGEKTLCLDVKTFAEGPVGRADMEQLEMEMRLRGKARGAVLSSAPFTREAVEFAGSRPGLFATVGLKEMARLMYAYSIGTSTTYCVELKAADPEFFAQVRDGERK